MRPWVLNQLIIISVFSFLFAHAGTKESGSTAEVPVATDLHTLALESNQNKVPMLIMYAAKHCEYCERLEDDLLGPMYISGQYNDRVIIRKVMIDAVLDIRDFSGNMIDAEEFAFKQGVEVTPTLRFVDANGNALAPDMIGYNTPEIYSAYIDKAIESSTEVIRKNQSN